MNCLFRPPTMYLPVARAPNAASRLIGHTALLYDTTDC